MLVCFRVYGQLHSECRKYPEEPRCPWLQGIQLLMLAGGLLKKVVMEMLCEG